MIDVFELHEKANGLLASANLYEAQGNDIALRKALEEAYSLERQVAEEYLEDYDDQPTRAILLARAAQLALRLGKYSESVMLARAGLRGQVSSDLSEILSETAAAASKLLDISDRPDQFAIVDLQFPEQVQKNAIEEILSDWRSSLSHDLSQSDVTPLLFHTMLGERHLSMGIDLSRLYPKHHQLIRRSMFRQFLTILEAGLVATNHEFEYSPGEVHETSIVLTQHLAALNSTLRWFDLGPSLEPNSLIRFAVIEVDEEESATAKRDCNDQEI